MAENKPFVSVIMPIRNEGDFIARSLGAVLEQDYPHECMEVLIADGMSTDQTRAVIADTAAQHPEISVRVLDNPGQIVPTGFNIALANSRGDVIVRVDGHTIIEPDYVRQCVALLQQSGADNVGGRMTAIGRGEFGEAVALATSSPFGVGGARFHYSDQEEWVDTVYMGAWPRAVFNRLGGFDEELVRNQDDEFNYRLRADGGKILLSPKISSRYYNRSTPRSLWRQYYQYGFWKVRVLQKHPLQMSPRQFAPPTLAATILGGAILAPFSRVIRVLWLLAVTVYALGNLAASWQIARKTDERHFRLLPGIFAILHFGYGLGFLRGLLKEAVQRLSPPTDVD
jgi:succinoglycan biosynthesis protein ExoA